MSTIAAQTLCKCPGETCSEDCQYFNVSMVADILDLNDWIDDPPANGDSLDGFETLRAVAWFITEGAIRFHTGKCSSTAPETGPSFTCQCCRYYASLNTPKTRHIREIATR